MTRSRAWVSSGRQECVHDRTEITIEGHGGSGLDGCDLGQQLRAAASLVARIHREVDLVQPHHVTAVQNRQLAIEHLSPHENFFAGETARSFIEPALVLDDVVGG